MGGIINELEQKIQANQMILNEYENHKNFLSIQNTNYNNVYRKSFDHDWINKYVIKSKSTIGLINYRQSLINEICQNNDEIDRINEKIKKHINISNFLQRIYFFINLHL